jgi:DNA/RNA endonuclease YhcR with UshA esterase domain
VGLSNESAVMSEIAGIIDALESRTRKLVAKCEGLEKQVSGLKGEVENAAAVIKRQSDDIAALKSEYESLKVANSLLGSEENKRDTKLKINSLIREIDYCIAQLAD